MLPSGNDAASVLAENLGACIYYERLGESHLLVGKIITIEGRPEEFRSDGWHLEPQDLYRAVCQADE